MTEQDTKRLDDLIEGLQGIQQHLGRAAEIIEDMTHGLSWHIQETRKTNACAIAEMIEEALRSNLLPGGKHELTIDGSPFSFTQEHGMKQMKPREDIPF